VVNCYSSYFFGVIGIGFEKGGGKRGVNDHQHGHGLPGGES
jgi:hypothetical protein